jgi:hypothetical protein
MSEMGFLKSCTELIKMLFCQILIYPLIFPEINRSMVVTYDKADIGTFVSIKIHFLKMSYILFFLY